MCCIRSRTELCGQETGIDFVRQSILLEIQRDFMGKGAYTMKEIVHVMLPGDVVEERISEMAGQINRDYQGKQIRLICILKGSVFFCCELAKHLTIPVTLDFMSVSSYGDGTESSGTIRIKKELDESVEGLDCLLVEDIIDSGRTLAWIKQRLLDRGPSSLRLCSLLDKPARRQVDISADYVGFEIPDEFVVGYGMDYAQKYRNLPYIGKLEFLNA